MTAYDPIALDPPRGGPGALGFLLGVLRRMEPRVQGLALMLIAATQVFSGLARLTRDAAPPGNWHSTLLSHSLMVGCIVLAVLAADEAVARGARRWAAYVLALFAACAFSAWAQWALLGRLGWDNIWTQQPPIYRDTQPLQQFFPAVLYGLIGCFVYVNHRTARLAVERMRRAETAREQSRRRTLESRLQAMQARVEPQFLFDTLARVRSLYERDSALGDRVLEHLITYLRAALPHLRDSTSTLRQEVELSRAWLAILRVQRGGRIAFRFDLAPGTAELPLPAMLLLPLLQLATSEPTARGAVALRVTARTEGMRLFLAIETIGDAFAPWRPHPALEPLGERLAALHGGAAWIEREAVPPGGSTLRLVLPLDGAAP
jgi:hypothetical protein